MYVPFLMDLSIVSMMSVLVLCITCMYVCMYVCVCTNFMTAYLVQGRCFWMFLSCDTAVGLLVNSCEWDWYWLENGAL